MKFKEESFNKYEQPDAFGFGAQNPGKGFLLITIRDNVDKHKYLWLLPVPKDHKYHLYNLLQ